MAKVSPPAPYRVGLIALATTLDVRLPYLLQTHFLSNSHSLNRAWTELKQHGCCDLGMYTRDIAETKVVMAQEAAIRSGFLVQFYMTQVPVAPCHRGC